MRCIRRGLGSEICFKVAGLKVEWDAGFRGLGGYRFAKCRLLVVVA